MRTLRRCACVPITAGVLVLPIWFAPEPALAQPPEPEPAFVLFIVDELMHDDNLFRVPHESVNNPSLRPIEHVEDYANQLTVGARARLQSGRQTLRVAARVSDVQFHRNDQLDYTGGQANLALDWELGSRLSGRVLGDYRRSLASYTNYRFFERDIVEAIDGALETRIGIGPRFALLSSVRARQTDHSDPERRSENFESDAASVGLEYAPSQTKRFALEYRYLQGDFPNSLEPSGPSTRDRSYEETLVRLRTEYALTAKLRLSGNVGALARDYASHAVTEDYSGSVWETTLAWQPRAKLGFELSAWRQLKAYVDAESDYFIARGVSFGPTWAPTNKLRIAFEYFHEEQDYIGKPTLASEPDADGSVVISDDGRRDDVDIARISASYVPRDFLELDLTWACIDRGSNRAHHDYDARVASVAVRFVF